MSAENQNTFIVNHVTYIGTEKEARTLHSKYIDKGWTLGFEAFVRQMFQEADMEAIRKAEFERQEKEMEEYFREPSKQVKEFTQALSNFVNGSSSRETGDVIKEFFKDHRTLQQSTIKLFLQIIEAMAQREPGKHTDARNEDSQLVCSQIIEGFRKVRAEYDTKKLGRPTNKQALPSQYLRFI